MELGWNVLGGFRMFLTDWLAFFSEFKYPPGLQFDLVTRREPASGLFVDEIRESTVLDVKYRATSVVFGISVHF